MVDDHRHTDKYTVVLKSGQPAPLVFDSFEFFNMADKDTLEGPDAKSKAVGTGPFVFAEWSRATTSVAQKQELLADGPTVPGRDPSCVSPEMHKP